MRKAWIFAGFVLTIAGAAQAGVDSWTPISPAGGIFTLAVAPGASGTLYAASQAGAVYRSFDFGATWSVRGNVPGGLVQMNSLTVDPGNRNTLYAAGSEGLCKSRDGGASWRFLPSGFAVYTVAAAPSAPQSLYAVGGDFNNQPGPPVQRSDDGGATWRTVGGMSSIGYAFAVAVDPVDSRTAYALFFKNGLWRTSDGGDHWTRQLALSQVFFGKIVIDPRQPKTVLVTAGPVDTGTANLWRSTDAGVTWAPASAGPPGSVGDLAFGPSGTLYVETSGATGSQLLVSSNQGASWQRTVQLRWRLTALAADAGPAGRLYARSLDQGIVLASADAGSTWLPPAHGPTGEFVRQVLAGPAGTGLYVSQITLLGHSGAALMQTVDDGANWTLLSSGDELRLTLDAQPGVLYAIDVDNDATAIVSDDNGVNWRGMTVPEDGAGNNVALAADPGAAGRIDLLRLNAACAGGPPGCGHFSLYHSDSGGADWRLVSTLDDGSPLFSSLTIDPLRGQTVYLGAGSLFESTAARPALTPLSLPGQVIDLAIDPALPRTLYAAVALPRAVFKSVDGGATWAAAVAGLPLHTQALALAIDPVRPATLYLGTSSGVFVTDDGAASWQPLDAGLPGLPVASLAVSPTLPRTVWAGTTSAGVFSLTRP